MFSGTLTLSHFLSLGAILFALSVIGIFLNRRNLIVLLMAIELMLLAVNLNFIAFSYYLGDMDGQVFVFFILTVAAADALAEETGNDGADQGRKRNDEQEVLRNHIQPLSESSSCTLIDSRLRNSTTRIARPMADSAAATVRMKKTKTWPSISPR